MTALLLSNRRPFQSENLYVLLLCHMMNVGRVGTYVLHIISNECKATKFQILIGRQFEKVRNGHTFFL